MAQDIVNKNQDISYTNLDFSSIYSEIVDLAKQLSYRWDPSISDESDPGVVLLKLNALIADKMDYNIDKSVLEAFPLSVTQEGNARQLYEQLGYYMNWYESAVVPVNMTWLGDSSPDTVYTIPKFTIITDSETSRSYALIGTVDNNTLVVSDAKLPVDGTTIQMIAMEGTPTTFSFLGETKITSEMVDENNRLYFETKYVSQNGIFIKNSGNSQENYLDWKRVDNLYEQPYDNLRYKFGIDSSSDVAYIEFPDNYAELIGAGIEIVYMIVNPDFSNIPPQTLDRFLVELVPRENQDIILNTSNVNISNPISAVGHKNIESIDEAYVNYKRTVGTFKTLITLRDYINYILREGEELYSNGFVTDRSNDPQLTYKVMSKVNGIDSLITEIEEDEHYESVDVDAFESGITYYTYITPDPEAVPPITGGFTPSESYSPNTQYFIKVDEDKLTPFDLKFYLLQDVISVNSNTTFNQTFDMIKSEDLPSIDAMIEDSSHIEHTYKPIISPEDNTYIKCTPSETSRDQNTSYYYYDSKLDRYEFISNVYYALNNNGEEVTYYNAGGPFEEAVFEHTTDPFVDGVTYYERTGTGDTDYVYAVTTDQARVSTKTYYLCDNPEAQYYQYNEQYDYYFVDDDIVIGSNISAREDLYNQITVESDVSPYASGWYKIDIEALFPHIAFFRAKYPLNMTITTYSVVGKDIQSDIKTNVLNAFYQNLNATQLNFGEKIELDYLTEIVLKADTRIKSVLFDNIEYDVEAVYFDEQLNQFIGVILPENIRLPNYADEYSVTAYDLCKDIFAKSILAGTTRLLDQDTTFSYHLNQYHIWDSGTQGVYSMQSETVIDLNSASELVNELDLSTRNYTLKENEVINLLRPKLSTLVEYQTGIHFEYLLNSTVQGGTSYQLSDNEVIAFYATQLDENKLIKGYTTKVYTKGAIIKPSFTLQKQNDPTALSQYLQTQILQEVFLGTEKYYSYSTESKYWTTNILDSSSIINNVITGSDDIAVQEINTITIVPSDSYSFYWVLNKQQKSEKTGKKFYELFGAYDPETDRKDNGKINSYTLKSGEVLYYSDKDGKNLIPLTEGTTITRNCGINTEFQDITNDTVFLDYISINTDSTDYIFTLVTDSNGNPSPKLNGMYKLDGTSYVPATEESMVEGTDYFIMVMRSTNGYYEKNTTTLSTGEDSTVFNACPTITQDVFNKISISDDQLNDLDPSANNYYERVTYDNAIEIEDVYYASGDFGTEDISISRPRYVKTTDTSIINEHIYDFISTTFEVNNVDSYPETISMSSDSAYLYAPLYNSLYDVEVTDSPEYYTFYSDDQGTSATVTTSTIPIQEGLYEYDGTSYKKTTKVYSYKPVSATPSMAASPLSVVGSVDKATKVLGYYYRFSTDENTYRKQLSNESPISLVASANDIMMELYSTCYKYKISNPSLDLTLSGLDNLWNRSYSTATPSQFLTYNFKQKGSGDTGTHRFVSQDEFDSVQTSTIIAKLGSNNIYAGSYTENSNTKYGYFIPKSMADGTFDMEDENEYLIDASTVSNKYAIISDGVIQVWYNAVSRLERYINQIPLFGIPNYYRLLYLCKGDFDKYYVIKDFADKTFAPIDPWECEAITLDKIVNNPSKELIDYWVQLQDNCSVTITANDVYTLNEGDTITATAKDASVVNTRKVEWPRFSNTETILNLNNYDISYTKTNNEVTSLENISIINSDWRGYSSLLINTSNPEGQVVHNNQTIVFLDKDDNPLFSIPDGIEDKTIFTDHDVIFQLKNPLSNKAGSTVEVITYDDIGNEIANSAYVFYKILSNHNVQYLPTYETDIVSDSAGEPIELPFNQPTGKYLLSMTSNVDLEGVDLKLVDDRGYEYEMEVSDFASGLTSFLKNKTYFLSVGLENPYTTTKNATVQFNDTIIMPDGPLGDLTNTDWEFNETLTGLRGDPHTFTYAIDFTYEYDGSTVNANSIEITIGSTDNDLTVSYSTQSNVYSNGSWADDDYRTIAITGGARVGDDLLINLMENLATLHSSTTALNFTSNDTEFTSLLLDADSLEMSYIGTTTETPYTGGVWSTAESDIPYRTLTITVDWSTLSDELKEFFEENASISFEADIVESSLIFPAVANMKVILGDVFKYENSALLEGADDSSTVFNEVFDRVKGLDNKYIFNYTFQPNENDVIENPLDPKMFWNKNHVYNAYTIPQLDLSSSDNISYRFITSK